jgi:hypothetical protein
MLIGTFYIYVFGESFSVTLEPTECVVWFENLVMYVNGTYSWCVSVQ